MTVRVDNPAPASYDLGQLRALAQARFGSSLVDVNEVRADNGATLIAVYLPTAPNGQKATAWTADLAGYTVAHPTSDDLAANQATILGKAQQALIANATFLALASPTATDVRNQTVALTREVNGLLRFLLGQFDSTTGT